MCEELHPDDDILDQENLESECEDEEDLLGELEDDLEESVYDEIFDEEYEEDSWDQQYDGDSNW